MSSGPTSNTVEPNTRLNLGLAKVDYRLHDWSAMVTRCRCVCRRRRRTDLGFACSAQNVGVKQVGDRICLVSAKVCDPGHFADETCRLEPIENPFGPKVLPMSPE